MVRGPARGTRRAAAPTPVMRPSRIAASNIQLIGSTSGSSAPAAHRVATAAHSASRARPLMLVPRFARDPGTARTVR